MKPKVKLLLRIGEKILLISKFYRKIVDLLLLYYENLIMKFMIEFEQLFVLVEQEVTEF